MKNGLSVSKGDINCHTPHEVYTSPRFQNLLGGHLLHRFHAMLCMEATKQLWLADFSAVRQAYLDTSGLVHLIGDRALIPPFDIDGVFRSKIVPFKG